MQCVSYSRLQLTNKASTIVPLYLMNDTKEGKQTVVSFGKMYPFGHCQRDDIINIDSGYRQS